MVSVNKIKHHDKASHNEMAKHVCDLCDFRSFTAFGVKAHKGRFHVSLADKIPCSNGCGSLFNQHCSMLDHIRRNCRLDPESREKYKQIDKESGRTEAHKRWNRAKIERHKLILNNSEME